MRLTESAWRASNEVHPIDRQRLIGRTVDIRNRLVLKARSQPVYQIIADFAGATSGGERISVIPFSAKPSPPLPKRQNQMNKFLLSVTLLLVTYSACFGQQPKPTPIPRIKCYPVESGGKVVDWHCVDVPPECVTEPKPKKPEVK